MLENIEICTWDRKMGKEIAKECVVEMDKL